MVKIADMVEKITWKSDLPANRRKKKKKERKGLGWGFLTKKAPLKKIYNKKSQKT